MTKDKIEAKQICIDDLFGNKYLFDVPMYQRPFVWEQEDFERLFMDIKDEMKKNKMDKGNTFEDYEPYFLGSIVLHTTKYRDDESGTYDIIERIVVDWISGATQERRVSLIYKIIELINRSEKARDVLNNPIFRVEEKKSAFENALDDINFYNRGGNRKLAKYSLLRIDMERTDNSNKRSSYEGKITVERILPENIDSGNKYWSEMFKDEDERLECTDKLGNLTLLNGGINSKASNKPFPEKKKYYFEKRKSSFDVTNELKNYTDWSIEALKERHERLKDEAIEIWIESERGTTKLNSLRGKGFASNSRKKR